MSRRKKPTPSNQDVETAAIWLFGACREDAEGRDKLRRLVAKAAQEAKEMYETPEDLESDGEPPEDGYEVRAILSRFASTLDELERQLKEDNQ